MNNKYTFPHVNISTTSMTVQQPTVSNNTNTRLFAPFISTRGPENQIVVVENYTDFKNIYGDFDYTVLGQEQIFNIAQWFAGGGVVLAFRMTQNLDKYIERDSLDKVLVKSPVSGDSDTSNIAQLVGYATGTYRTGDVGSPIDAILVEAKYPGKEYSGYKVEITFAKSSGSTISLATRVNINVINSAGETVEYMRNVKLGEINTTFSHNSAYISNIELLKHDDTVVIIGKDITKCEITLSVSGSIDEYCIGESISTEAAYATFMNKVLCYALKQPLESQCDVFLDAGYPVKVKRALLDFFAGTTLEDDTTNNYHRNDIFLYLTEAYIDRGVYKKMYKMSDIAEVESSNDYSTMKCDNVAISTHYFKDVDSWSNAKIAKEVYYTLNYYLAANIPYNDRQYGRNKAQAGKARAFIGTTSDIKWINKIPTDTQKQKYAQEQVNYVEKENDSYYIMLQMTQLIDDNPNKKTLTKINHKRTCLLMEREIKSIARDYLHEVNDQVNKTQLRNRIIAYLNTWVNNRTIIPNPEVILYDSSTNTSLLDTEIAVVMYIKFYREVEIVDLQFNV